MVITEKHKQILEKAEALFAVKGFDGATVRDIAEAAGVNLAMISYYFGSKEKLMEALFRERMEAMQIRVENLVKNPSLAPFQKVEILIDEYINRVMQKQDFYKIMLCEQIINKNSSVLKQLRELKLNYANLIGTLLAEGQKQKVFKKNIDVILLLTTMTGTVTQFIINKDYYRDFHKLKTSELDTMIQSQLSSHIKQVFKALLGYEQ